jgi:tripartite-type tricarboxylate transporter receptor subunit TctC
MKREAPRTGKGGEMNRKSSIGVVVAIILSLALSAGTVHAAGPFEGKVVRIIVGLSAGGGFDAYARMIARHLGRHIPGDPTVVVDNMPGAGSLISANYMYKVAKPDGLAIGHFDGALLMLQALGQQGIEFDARKFEYIGAPLTEGIVCLMSRPSGITSVEKWMASKTPVKMGGSVTGAYAPDNVIRILKVALGLPVHLVEGYKGAADIRMAIASGELEGTAYGWVATRATWSQALKKGDVVVVLQDVPKSFPDLPNVPLAINLAKTDEARQLIELGIHRPRMLVRPFVLPPGTPKERVGILRKAFMETLQDKQFLVEAEKANLSVEPITGDELEKTVLGMLNTNPALLAKLKEILFQ